VVHNAIRSVDAIIAIVVATSAYTLETGAEASVIAVPEGDFSEAETIVDQDGHGGPCFRAMWATRMPLIGEFFVRRDNGTLATLRLWPILLPDGSTPRDADSVRAVDPNELLVAIEDEEPITVAELMRRGREFVEPTATPGPPRPTVLAPDSGGRSGVVAPNTGRGGAASDGRRDAIIGIGAAAVAAMGAAGALAMARGRRSG
jgi:hypothetical protein